MNRYSSITDYVVFDLETTGLSSKSEIIEIAAVKVHNDEIIDKFESLVKPIEPIPYSATNVNNITNEMVLNAPSIEEVMPSFLDFIGTYILVGHNINSFDMRILSSAAYSTYGIKIDNETIDTLNLAKHCLSLSNYTLGDLCKYFSITNHDAHRALSDVIATYNCFINLKTMEYSQKDLSAKTDKKPKNFKPNYSDESKALQTLQGILLGVTCDGVLTEDEVYAVKQWLNDYKYLSGNYPFDVAYSEIEDALEDGILEPAELQHLLKKFQELIDPVKTRHDTQNLSEFNNKVVCLSGEFSHGSKSDIGAVLEEAGATLHDTMTKKVDILIVGNFGSEAWLCGNYGGKVKKAVEMQNKGLPIKIITEDDMFKILNGEIISSDIPDENENAQLSFIDSNEAPNVSIHDVIAEIVERNCTELNIDRKYIKISETTSGISVWILEPVDNKKSDRIFGISCKTSSKNPRYEVSIKHQREKNVPIPYDGEKNYIKIKQKDNDGKEYYAKKLVIYFPINSSTVFQYLDDIFKFQLKAFEPAEKFGCCGQYLRCSNAKQCVHRDTFYAKACYYKRNLESGHIFFGKNAVDCKSD